MNGHQKKCGRYTCKNDARYPSSYCSRACERAHYAHLRKAKARQRAFVALKSGLLAKPSCCELCQAPDKLVAHHWHGYSDEHATNVWWICQRCNMQLIGDSFHDGSVSMEQARAIISGQYAVT